MSLCLLALGAEGASQAKDPAAPTITPEQAAFFETKIRPVFAASCLPCHGKANHMSGLSLDTRDGFVKGGDSGPLTLGRDPANSLLVRVVRQTGPVKMPQGGKLSPTAIADIETWVKMGAPWPADSKTQTAHVEKLWSLEPVRLPKIPPVKLSGWVRNPIDSLILAQLESRKLKPAPEADKRTLIRRVTYDLTGLPPTAGETDTFLQDKSPNAYDKVVDRLLESPHYGERWGRHWLDVARYADTKGYVFNEDRNYYNAYTYRDWVINAMNHDLPYDQFIAQQLAADLIPQVKDGDDKRPLAALGFLTVGRRFLNSAPDIIDDRIDVTMRGFEGFTVACARCHDHKFDPIPTQDYYSLYSVFNSSQEKETPISDKAITNPWERHNAETTSTEAAIRDLVLAEVKRLRQSTDASANVKRILQSVREGDMPLDSDVPTLIPAFEPSQRDRLKELKAKLEDLKKTALPAPEMAMAMVDRPDASDGVVFRRGNPGNRGAVAPRRFLEALSKPGEERAHWTNGSGRLDLAKAIGSKDNPLTARVFVNRMWMYDFGSAIVRTPSDFGRQGEKPSNPELLDYMAAKFMSGGWSMKKLQRMIVTSAAYRQSSTASPATLEADPDNRLYSRMNRKRLDLEEMRDSVALAANKLDLNRVGGKSVDLWSYPFTDRRAVYGFIERQNLPGIFRAFDFATPDATSPKRFETTVPQQALFFMNSRFAVDSAKALAERPEILSAKDDAQKVRRLYLDLFERLPDSEEAAVAAGFLRNQGLSTVASPSQIWAYGYGGYDSSKGRITSFTPFEKFAQDSYRPTDRFPDPQLGYMTLNAIGGHPGRDLDHAVIRRWTAPSDLTVSIAGELNHGQEAGDGVRARIVSSRSGLVGEWKAHRSKAKTNVPTLSVRKGDTIDFAVDPISGDNSDSFAWAPTIRVLATGRSWGASPDFGAPGGPPMTRLSLYAQALLMSNEFMFLD